MTKKNCLIHEDVAKQENKYDTYHAFIPNGDRQSTRNVTVTFIELFLAGVCRIPHDACCNSLEYGTKTIEIVENIFVFELIPLR